MGMMKHVSLAVDWGVNKSIQNLRMLGCHKNGSSRTKSVIVGPADFASSLVTHIDPDMQPFWVVNIFRGAMEYHKKWASITSKKEREVARAMREGDDSDDDFESDDEEDTPKRDEMLPVIEACRAKCPELDIFRFTGLCPVANGGVIFNFEKKIIGAHQCSVCKSSHDNDNRTMGWVMNKNGAIYQFCHHGKGKKAINLRPATKNAGEKSEADELIEAAAIFEEHIVRCTIKPLFEEWVPIKGVIPIIPNSVTRVHQKELAEYPHFNHTLIIKSGMGTGKTQRFKQYIRKFNPKRILFITPRISLTRELISVFAEFGFVSYQESNFRESDRVACQYESLHKLMTIDGILTFDLIVLDELEQTVSCSDNFVAQKRTNSIKRNFEVLCHTIGTAEKCVVLDATLGPRSIGLMQSLRPGYDMVVNNYQTKKDVPHTIFESEADFDREIMKSITDGRKLMIACTTKTKLEKIESNIRAAHKVAFGDDAVINILTVHGDNSATPEVKKVLANINEEIVKFDVMIHTSSITAGVSITVDHFDKHYLYAEAGITDTLTPVQMIGRVRRMDNYNTYINDTRSAADGAMTREDVLAELYLVMRLLADHKAAAVIAAKRYTDAAKRRAGLKEYLRSALRQIRCGGDIAGTVIDELSMEEVEEYTDALRGVNAYMPFGAVRNEMGFTHPYTEMRLAQLVHKSWCTANYKHNLISYFVSDGHKIIPFAASAPRDDETAAKEAQVKTLSVEIHQKLAKEKIAHIEELMIEAGYIADGVEGPRVKDHLALVKQEILDLQYALNPEYSEQRPTPEDEALISKRLNTLNKIVDVECPGPHMIELALKKHKYIAFNNTISKHSYYSWKKADGIHMEGVSHNRLDEDGSEGAKWIYGTNEAEDSTQFRNRNRAFELLKLLGYGVFAAKALNPDDVNSATLGGVVPPLGGVVPPLGGVVPPLGGVTKATILEKAADIAKFAEDNSAALAAKSKRTKNRIDAATATYAELSRFINGVLDSIGWSLKTIGKKGANVVKNPVVLSLVPNIGYRIKIVKDEDGNEVEIRTHFLM